MIDVSPELIAFLKSEYDRCHDETLEDERTTAIERYNGEPYGDEVDGRSKVVARDTAEVVDYMVISILRTLVAGDDVVEFVHRNADLAHMATQAVKHLFMDEQDGYRILHDWLKAGLLEKNAVAMTYPEARPPKRRVLEGVSGMALVQAQQQGMEIKEAEQVGENEEGPIFNVAAIQQQPPKFCDAAVPNEHFYCSLDAETITDAPLKGHRTATPIYDLVAEGIPADELEGLTDGAYCDNLLGLARDDGREIDVGTRQGAARKIWLHQEYARFDENGDGIAELLYIRRTSDFKILSIEEMEDPEDHPYEDWSPFPMQHRRIGQSLADKVMDLERIRTVLWRQTLDGIYMSNNARTYVHEEAIGENTIEDLLTVRQGGIIRWRGVVPPTERTGNFDPGKGLSLLEHAIGERESRTGITRLNQGLDADALNKTATGTALMQAQGQQVEEYLARNFANALARLFTKKAKLLKRYGQPIMVPIDGEYVEVDPKQWPEDMLARPRVGLGSGRKEQRLAFRREVIGYQMAALEAGLPIVDAQTMYASAKGFVADADLGDVSEFFNDPAKLPPQEPKPDPEMMKVQAQVQLEQNKLQMKQQELAAKLQLQQAEADARIQMMQAQGVAKAQIDAQKAQNDAQMAMLRAQAEAQIAQQRMEIDAVLEAEKLRMEQARAANDERRRDGESSARMDKMRKGGSLAK